MKSVNVDELLKEKEFEITELQNLKLHALKNDLDEKNRKIYDLIQQNENLLLNDQYKTQNFTIKEQEIKQILRDTQNFKEILKEKDCRIYELNKENEKIERILNNELSNKDAEIRQLKQHLNEYLNELNFFKMKNSSLESQDEDNDIQLQEIKLKLDKQIKEKEGIIDKIIQENNDLKSKNIPLEEFKTKYINENDRSEKNYQKLTNSLYKEIEALKTQVSDFELKMNSKKNKTKNKIEKLKKNYFNYLEDYEKRHLDQIKEMKENFDLNDFELKKLTLENEQLKSKVRLMSENKQYSTNEIIKNLERNLIDMGEKLKSSQNDILNREFEIKKLKEELNFIKTQEKTEKNGNLSSDDGKEYEFNYDLDDEIILSKIQEKFKNEKYFVIIEKKFKENELLNKNCNDMQNEIEDLKKENIALGYEIIKLQNKLNELENVSRHEKEKLFQENIKLQLENKRNLNKILKSEEKFLNKETLESKFVDKTSINDKKLLPEKIFKPNFSKLKDNLIKNIPIKLQRYENFEKIDNNDP